MLLLSNGVVGGGEADDIDICSSLRFLVRQEAVSVASCKSVKGNLTPKGEVSRLRYWEPVLTAANEASRVLGANPKTHNAHNNNQCALELSTALTLLITEKGLYPLLSTGVV